jgi:hypothetical protein
MNLIIQLEGMSISCLDDERDLESFINDLINEVDVFAITFGSGYWAAGVHHQEDVGWLVWEHNDERVRDQDHSAAIRAFALGEPLPERYYRLDREAAIRAFLHGVRLFGATWLDGIDGPQTDRVVQCALLGVEKYG